MRFRCIDFETTGIPTEDDTHAIVEIGWCDVGDAPRSVLCNPGRPIPPEAMAVHHITDEMVRDATGDIGVIDSNECYFVAHNADYERQFYQPATPYICTYKVAMRLWPDAPSHGLQFLRYYLALDVDAGLAMPPHRAGPDAYVCAALMSRILEEGRVTVDEMVRWSSGPALLPRVTFGKHKGADWADVPTDYLEWIVFKSDMDRDIKANANHHLKKRGN